MIEPHNPPPAAPGQGAGPIAELIRALADLGLRPDSRELAGAVWLALRIGRVTPGWSTLDADGAPPLPPPAAPTAGAADRNDPPAASGDGPDSRRRDGHATGSPEPDRAAGIPAFPLTARAAAGAVAASAVSVPDHSYLPQALHLGRAWRMLRRRRPSRRACALDLEATVERFVEQRLNRQGLWGLVYRARSVPWLDLTLVIDRGPAMAVWEPQVRELTALLRRTGAFGTVRIRHLESATAAPRLFEAGRLVPAAALGKPLPGAEPGHMLTLVLSDGISRAWYDPATYRLLNRMGRDGLAVLVQLLPANRWIDTALGAGVEVRLGVARTRDPKLPVIAPLAGDADALPVISQTPWGVRTLVDLLRAGGGADRLSPRRPGSRAHRRLSLRHGPAPRGAAGALPVGGVPGGAPTGRLSVAPALSPHGADDAPGATGDAARRGPFRTRGGLLRGPAGTAPARGSGPPQELSHRRPGHRPAGHRPGRSRSRQSGVPRRGLDRTVYLDQRAAAFRSAPGGRLAPAHRGRRGRRALPLARGAAGRRPLGARPRADRGGCRAAPRRDLAARRRAPCPGPRGSSPGADTPRPGPGSNAATHRAHPVPRPLHGWLG